MENKNVEFVIDKYNSYQEDTRFDRKFSVFEYWTTMHYIDKYIGKNAKILEAGAGTGRYSIALAKQGHNVTSIELVKSNLDVLLQNSKGMDNILGLQGDALDLSKFADNSFDMVLNLGPMYHLFTDEERIQAIKESIRICKTNGICMFAYVTHGVVVLDAGIRHRELKKMAPYIQSAGTVKAPPEFIFSTSDYEEFSNYFKDLNVKPLHILTTDNICYAFREKMEVLEDDEMEILFKWHLSTCEKIEMRGNSAHMLYIVKKT